MKSLKLYPTLAEAATHMDCSGGMRFSSEQEICAALARAAYMREDAVAEAEAELAKFAADHAFALQWAATGTDDEGNAPPISANLNAVLEDIYDFDA